MQQTPTTDPLSQLRQEDEQGVAALFFKVDSSPASFIAEYALDGADLVYHFYPPKGGLRTNLWKQEFARCLEATAVSHFHAAAPRLRAAYTEEMSSWWLRARGFAEVGDPDLSSQSFFRKLDDAFSAEIQKAREGNG